MSVLGNIISRSINLRNSLPKKNALPIVYQRRTLRKLLEKAQHTAFGKAYDFEHILLSIDDFVKVYQEKIPIRTYNEMYRDWWHRLLDGEENITWPGKVKYFALSSGTSESASKHIPVTSDMISSIKKVAMKQFYSMSNFDISSPTFSKGILMLGGSTSLQEKRDYFEGDMSGISAKNIPRIFSNLYYKPGQKIAKTPDWEDRINLIIENAERWDVGTLAGVPAWAQIVLDKIIEHYNLNSIHDIWPNLEVYIHGGVSFEPYKDHFQKLLGRPINYIETYMASEGSFGFKATPNGSGIKLVLNAGIFYEFIPFNQDNFDTEGNLIGNPKTYLINEVNPEEHYALILSTCAGAWRYLIGDVLKFTDVAECEIALVGRTKQFLSICGEHISVDNLNQAIESAIQQFDIKISDFSVAGYRSGKSFTHHWFIGTDNDINPEELKKVLDQTLCDINDDYAVERTSALANVEVSLLPECYFEEYMRSQGKFGAMSKFPRVLKNGQLDQWRAFLDSKQIKEIKTTQTSFSLS